MGVAKSAVHLAYRDPALTQQDYDHAPGQFLFEAITECRTCCAGNVNIELIDTVIGARVML